MSSFPLVSGPECDWPVMRCSLCLGVAVLERRDQYLMSFELLDNTAITTSGDYMQVSSKKDDDGGGDGDDDDDDDDVVVM
jgi:hypothetical protein